MDELHIANHGSTGNVAECSVSVASPDHAMVGDVLDANAPEATDVEAQALEVRPMEVGDAAGLVRCIYRCYGYTYKDHRLYEPRHIAQALGRGLLRSVVAVTPSGEVVGHCALFVQRPGDRVPEAGKLVVDPRFRGHHLAERMAAVRIGAARDKGIPGFWAQAVANHPSSQKEIAHFGGVEVGLLIGASPSSVVMTAIENANEGRRSLVAMYTPLERRSQTIYVPAAHLDLLAGLQAELGLARSFAVGGELGHGPSKLRVIVVPDTGTAHIRVERIGADVLTRIADELDGLDAFDLGAVYLDVGLAEPGAGTVGTELDRLGFCFAAWLPCRATGN